jgi:putative ABC transport system permease protein
MALHPAPLRSRSHRTIADLAETLPLAWESLLANRLRSILTMLGVIIGIAAVIAMVTIGRGAQLQTENQLKLSTDIQNCTTSDTEK